MLNKLFIHSQEIARKIDQCAINEYHIPSLVLMEQASAECCRIIQNKEDPQKKYVFFVAREIMEQMV